jgi:hypothetical protein
VLAHLAWIDDSTGQPRPYTGPVGPIPLVDGVSVEPVDTSIWWVKRLIDARDEGGHLCPGLRIVREDPSPPAVAPEMAPGSRLDASPGGGDLGPVSEDEADSERPRRSRKGSRRP